LPFSGGANTISGKVLDSAGNGIPGARVTLYNAVWVPYEYKATDQVRLKGVKNPQVSGDGSALPVGEYEFTGVPSGAYIITAEIGDASAYESVQATGGSRRQDLVITGYIENYSTPTPQPSKPSVPTSPPVSPSGPQGPDAGAVFGDALRVMLMGVVGVQLIVSVVVIAMHVARQK
jgi:hypothetical protein